MLDYFLSVPDNIYDVFSLLLWHLCLLKINHGIHFMATDDISFSNQAMVRKSLLYTFFFFFYSYNVFSNDTSLFGLLKSKPKPTKIKKIPSFTILSLFFLSAFSVNNPFYGKLHQKLNIRPNTMLSHKNS